jgi:SAM-dependent methyltransferase
VSVERLAQAPVCPLCGNAARLPASRFEPLYSCRECGIILNARSESRTTEEERYLSIVFDSSHAVAEQQINWLHREWTSAKGTLLDVGCGSGSFLVKAREFGWTVSGVDISAPAVQVARTRLGEGADLRSGNVETAGFPRGAFDVITLWDVLDHLHEPALVLGALHSLLRPGGMLLARVRNGPVHLRIRSAELWVERLRGRPRIGARWGVIHRYGFSPRSLRRLLQNAEFDSVEICDAEMTTDARDRSTGAGPWLSRVKRLVKPWLAVLGRWTGYRVYPSPTIFVRGRRPQGGTRLDGVPVN